MIRSIGICTLALMLFTASDIVAEEQEPLNHAEYVVVTSRQNYDNPDWRKVVEALRKKHGPDSQVVIYNQSVVDSLPALRHATPHYVCFVATPAEAGRDFVADVHRLMRKIDDDPYSDAIWGILTGYDAAGALAIAETRQPLVVKQVASGTEVALDRCSAGVWYSELEQGRMVRKLPGGEATTEKGPADTTQVLADTINRNQADLFVTSGHATERDWQIGFRYRNGSFQSKAGKLFGVDVAKQRIDIQSDSPKVYLPIGNCLMGHIDGPDAMALAFMQSAGVRQMIGYTVLTWYGYGGWGCLDYFVEQPGRYTFAEAFAANELALVHRLETYFPEIARMDTPPGSMARLKFQLSDAAKSAGLSTQDGIGLLHDRDVVAFYGDPAWEAKMAPGKLAYEQALTRRGDGAYVFEVKPLAGEKSFDPVNTNGSQRGGRPIIQFFEHRMKDLKIIEGADLKPVLRDDFLLIPNPRKCEVNQPYRVVFTAVEA